MFNYYVLIYYSKNYNIILWIVHDYRYRYDDHKQSLELNQEEFFDFFRWVSVLIEYPNTGKIYYIGCMLVVSTQTYL